MFVAIAAIALSAQGGSWPPSTKCDFNFVSPRSSPPILCFQITPSPGQQPPFGSFEVFLGAPPGTYWYSTGPGNPFSRSISVNQADCLYPMPGQTVSRFALADIQMNWQGDSGSGSRSESVVLDGRSEQEKLAAPKIDEATFWDSKLASGDLYFRGKINLPPGQSLVPNGLEAQYRVGDGPYQPMTVKWYGNRFLAFQRDSAVRDGSETTIRIIYRQSPSNDNPNFAWGTYRVRYVQPAPQGATSTSPPRNAPFNLRCKNATMGVRG